jgi:hypothetical protein
VIRRLHFLMMAVSGLRGLSFSEITSPRIRIFRMMLSHVQKYVDHAYGLLRQRNVAREPGGRVGSQLFVHLSWGIDNLYKNNSHEHKTVGFTGNNR